MTREEAIAEIERLLDCAKKLQGPQTFVEFRPVPALEMALAALRTFSREQVEKAFPGCEMCREEKKVKSDNFCGAATIRVVGDSIDLHGDDKKIKFFGRIYAPSFSIKFCPFCGKPLTDEAVEMVIDRMEGMENG